jgi:hypothetical protein
MNLTMTRVAQAACAERGFALRRLHHNPVNESERGQLTADARDRRTATGEVQPQRAPEPNAAEKLGMVLLGIDFETTIA